MTYKIGILSSHPVQYYSPWYRELASRSDIDLVVYYSHQPTQQQQSVGFGVAFEWDIPLFDGYEHKFLLNQSRYPSTDNYLGCDTPEIANIISCNNFDGFLVHGWYNRSYLQAIRACWRTRTPVLVRGDSTLLMESGRLKRFVKWFTHRCFIPKFDAYLIVGQRSREYFLAYGAKENRMEFCPHFVDNDRFARESSNARAQRNEFRQKLGIGASEMVFLFVGKFQERKRPLDFVRAVAMLRNQGLNAVGLMVGDGPMRNLIQEEILATNAPIQLTGFINQSSIPNVYAISDVLILPSEKFETWGLVVNEAMACGLPAVVSDRVGCAVDLITNGVTGFVYPCGNVNSLTGCLVEMATAPAQTAKLGAAAAKRIETYSVRSAADGLCRAVARLSTR